ncbi:Hint domain-containing protein [Sedimentitalea arenosa]|uniref:Hint domain-containing protein n=1 Tax=Sedimentitalea arenosa TaxID=2798803 RepID=A0A8J7LRD8_9RHOB|nr:Hint domain-containing protein [Arenibacterium arenosum]MBJ6371863.1 Hint domain-containing protein [Arenibacterium arenosum]
MPTTYSDQFYRMDPFAPPAPGTTLSITGLSYTDEDDDGFIEIGDTLDGRTITGVYPGDRIRVQLPNGQFDNITGVTFYLPGGERYFTPTDGTILQESTFVRTLRTVGNSPVPVGDLAPPCFTAGTLVMTDSGLRPVEALEPGDLVLTADEGLRPLLHLARRQFPALGKFAPVLIRAGAMGNPRDLCVSQEHRMLVSGWRAELYTGQAEILVAAKHLVNGRDIVIREGGQVEYVHLLFDRHQIVFAEGIASESYLPSHAVRAAEAGVNREILAMFPGLAAQAARIDRTARPVARRREATLLAG